MSWPMLKLTQDTTFYFFANHVKVCTFLSDYFRDCFGVARSGKGEEPDSSSTVVLMDSRNNKDQNQVPPPGKRGRYLRPPIHHTTNLTSGLNGRQNLLQSTNTDNEERSQTIEDNNGHRSRRRHSSEEREDDLRRLGHQRDVTFTNQPRLGARIQITGPSYPPHPHPIREGGGVGLTSPGTGGHTTRTTGTSTGSGSGLQGVKEQAGIMGNQGIRQHVETSTKTGVFHLSKAKLHEFPPELAKIVNALRSIDLSENKITMIPQNISAFVNLKHLNLNYNQIEVIPDQIGQLVKLETLSLSNNRIKSVPPTLSNLQKLRDVNLSSNQLTSFPVVFSSLKYLTVLDLARNRIPEVPDGVGGLQVVELILNQNQVRSVSKDLANCPNLKTLRLQENTLELAGLPKEILMNSPVSLLSLEGNLFDVKQLQDVEGYDKYMERYTSTKKKLT